MTPQEIGKSVADDIEQYGHFRGFPDKDLWQTNKPGKCCVVMNPTVSEIGEWSRQVDAYLDAVTETRPKQYLSTVEWSNQAPTEEVLTVLRSL